MSIAFINIERNDMELLIEDVPEILELSDIYRCVQKAIEVFQMAEPHSECTRILPVIHL